ncbi:unnamed protein product [Sympodiomycopsis kandeliae]
MTSHLTVPDLRERLASLDLSTDGKRAELQKRLRKALSKAKLEEEERAKLEASPDTGPWRPKHRHFLVTDVEATCEADDKGGGFGYPNEIIEFPVVLVRLVEPDSSKSTDAASGSPRLEIVDEFHSYIKPRFSPILTDFCKTLTGISQSQVDDSDRFQSVIWDLYVWLNSHRLIEVPEGIEDISEYPISCKGLWAENPWHPIVQASLKKDVIWVTHGPFDLLSFIPKSAWINGLLYGAPKFLRGPILDVRKSVHGYLGKYIPKPREAKEGSNGRTFHRSGPRDSKTSSKPADEQEKNDETTAKGANDNDERASEQTASNDDGNTKVDKEAEGGEASKDQTRDAKEWIVVEPKKPAERGDGSIPGLLQSMAMGEFEGKLHCGLDDTRNIARILVELGNRVFTGLSMRDDQLQDDDSDKAGTSRKPDEQGSSSSRPHTPPPSTTQLLQSLLQPNIAPYEYPPLPPLLTEEEQRFQNDPAKSTLTDSDRRLLKGGGKFYPHRYDWMGKKPGDVKWNNSKWCLKDHS